ncbi:hypothetical protein BHQ21_25770 [Mycobacterium sherrisii]|uniref:Uncharacterized protein n=1 Tax=Mycobacterium sherrisii TaxID=243061 RepID=A0A1E3S910_9MYCO|nr:hypothetical protein [Mycobacterium sherrisii]ODQ98636.1 hypothetical protein BHQ21_25770 [Mycobacterium sherrisii]
MISHDDERHDAKVRALTIDRAVVLTHGTIPPVPFIHAVGVDAFDGLVDETSAHQRVIADAVADYAARTRNRNLAMPDFPSAPKLKMDQRDEPAYRALSVADYVASAWTAWLATDEQRVRRTIEPRTGKSPWIMPDGLADPVLAEFPPEFAALAKPEPMS